jgi:hypothetical protein
MAEKSRESAFRKNGQSLIPPKILEPVRGKLGVSHRVLDIAMTQEVLEGASIMTVVGQLVPTTMTEHVRVNGKSDSGILTGPCYDLSHRGGSHWSAALADEQIGRVWILPP